MINIHGSCLSYYNKGILILGKSGTGKSDLCLRMIMNKGAKLVADDRVDIYVSGRDLKGRAVSTIAGLLEVKQSDRNTWRTVIDVQLTQKGLAMSDKRRATDEEAFVQVCRMVPVRIEEFRTVTENKVIECTYVFEERDITPIGEYKGFQKGRSNKDRRTFVSARGSWHEQ